MTVKRIALWFAAAVAFALAALFAVNFFIAMHGKADPDPDPGIIFEQQNRPRYS